MQHDVNYMQIQLIIDNRLRISLESLPNEVFSKLRIAFTHYNPMRAKLERMGVRGYALHKEPRVIETWRVEQLYLTFPRGGLTRLWDILEKYGLDIQVIDKRTKGNGPKGIPKSNITLRPFQEDIIQTCIETENCVVRSPTGSGKTTCAIALASKINLPTLVIVWTGGLFDQWIDRVQKELGLDINEIGMIRSGKISIKPITIGMQQTLVKHADKLKNKFGLVIVDEVQKNAAKTFMEVIDKFNSKYRIGISADEHRKDNKEFLIYDIFGGIGIDIKQEDLITQKYIHDVEIRVVPTDFEADWYKDLFLPEYSDNVPKHISDARLLSFNKLTNEMMNNVTRSKLAIQLAMDEIENGNQVILLSHRREWCKHIVADLLANSIECGEMLGGKESEKEYNETLYNLKNGKLRAAVGTFQAIGQGIDLPSISVGICCSPIANSSDGKPFFTQVRGRLCRISKGKESARLYYLYDGNIYTNRPIKNLIKWNKKVIFQKDAAWISGSEWLRSHK